MAVGARQLAQHERVEPVGLAAPRPGTAPARPRPVRDASAARAAPRPTAARRAARPAARSRPAAPSAAAASGTAPATPSRHARTWRPATPRPPPRPRAHHPYRPPNQRRRSHHDPHQPVGEHHRRAAHALTTPRAAAEQIEVQGDRRHLERAAAGVTAGKLECHEAGDREHRRQPRVQSPPRDAAGEQNERHSRQFVRPSVKLRGGIRKRAGGEKHRQHHVDCPRTTVRARAIRPRPMPTRAR